MSTTNRVALITGCGKAIGIGAASARALAASGVSVVVTDVAARGVANAHDAQGDMDSSWKGLETLVEQITAAGGKAAWTNGDVTSEADAAHMVGFALEKFGRLDILVNNAGAPHGKDRAPIEEVPVEAWDLLMGVNAKGTFLMSRAAVTPMRKQGWGRIINLSSAAAKYGRKNRATYSASKAAIVGFTHSLGVELAPYGITVNAICPGPILTARALSSARRESGSAETAAGLADRASRVPVGRHGRPEEIAGMVMYLASDASAFVTGQALSVCGGTT